jgi:hypothetical protein
VLTLVNSTFVSVAASHQQRYYHDIAGLDARHTPPPPYRFRRLSLTSSNQNQQYRIIIVLVAVLLTDQVRRVSVLLYYCFSLTDPTADSFCQINGDLPLVIMSSRSKEDEVRIPEMIFDNKTNRKYQRGNFLGKVMFSLFVRVHSVEHDFRLAELHYM